MDSKTATLIDELMQKLQNKRRQIEEKRQGMAYDAAKAFEIEKEIEALKKGETTCSERYTDFVQEFC